MSQPFTVSAWTDAIRNGWRRRCPRCGKAPLFKRWNQVRDNCSECRLTYLLNQGDPWVFLLFLDRGVFIFPPIIVVYFGLLPESVAGIVMVFGALGALLIYTTPHRYGVCVALDWLTRADDPDQTSYPSEAAAGSPPASDSSAPEPAQTPSAHDPDMEHDRG
ncbi:MAG: hypothetical protein GKS06_14220 [Acidobacteria bacterium]|nr:hypothetical protein [Acidobacteriota bacterium]